MTIEATRSTSTRPIDDDRDEQRGSSLPPPPARALHEPSSATRAKIDADLLAFVANTKAKEVAKPAAARPAPLAAGPSNDRVLYVGLNDESSATEAAGLRVSGASVTSVLRHEGATVRLDEVDFDLSGAEACDRFAGALTAKHGLAPDAAEKITKALQALSPSARDELARVAMVLAPGEHGASIPSRLVLSGHSDGTDVHMGGEALKFDAVLALARAMPNAARQVEDVHFSGCFTAAQVFEVDSWRVAFPNLRTMWGYAGIAPGTPVGHLQTWARATQGRSARDPAPSSLMGNITTWSLRDGIHTGVTLESLRIGQAKADGRFEPFVAGALETFGPWGDVKEDYEAYRQLSHRPELSAQEQGGMKVKADALLRIRYYGRVRTEFDNAHGEEIRSAFESLGLRVPNFSQLSRKEAVATIRDFEAKVQATRPLPRAVATAAPILDGLLVLDADRIPSAWCR